MASAIAMAEEAADDEFPVYESAADIPSRYFARAPETHFVRMSPNGEHFLTVTPSAQNYRIRVQSFDDDAQRRLFFGSIALRLLDAVYWGNNERLLLETSAWGYKDRHWGKSTVISAAEIEGQRLEKVWSGFARTGDAQARSAIINTLPDQPEHVLITFSEDEKSYPDVWRLDIYSGETTRLIEGQKNIDYWLASNDGDVLLGYGFDEDDIYVTTRLPGSASWKKQKFADYPTPWRFRPAAINLDKTHAYIIRDESTGPDSVWLYDLATGEFTDKVFQHETNDVSSLLINDTSGEIAGYGVTTDRYGYQFVNDEVALTQTRINQALPDAINRIQQFSPDGRYFLIHSTSDTNPGAFYRLDLEQNDLMLFGKINSKLDPAHLVATQPISYQARDGLTIHGYMTLPEQADERLPLVVMAHGGPHARDSVEYSFLEQFLVSRGYAVLKMNYRGSSGYGRSFEEMGHGEWGNAIQHDMLDGINFMVEAGIADPERVCIYGGSFGGYMALIETYREEPVIKCAIAFAPIADLKMHRKSISRNGGKWYLERVFGEMSGAELRKADPIRNVSDIQVPILLIHGDKDRAVDVEHSRKFAKKLEKTRKRHDYIELEGEGHSLSLGTTRNRVLQEVEEFLADHIGRSVEVAAR